jgi:hypothetical protein
MEEKKWKNEKIFFSFEEAEQHKTALQLSPEGATMEYKIKQKDGIFTVKSRVHPELIDAVREIDEKLSKKKGKL